MGKMVERGQAPRTVERVDAGSPKTGEQDHIHFSDGTALNKDGTVHDVSNGTHVLTNKERKWLEENGWL